VYDRTRTDVDR